MKIPAISVRVIMTSLVVVALDCVLFRSVQARPGALTNDLTLTVFGTLPMVHILAIVMAWVVRGRTPARPFQVGFEVGGWSALVATVFGIKPALLWLGSILEPTALGRWMVSSPVHELLSYFAFVISLPLLFQILVGLTTGCLGAWVGNLRGASPLADPARARLPVRSLAALVFLVAIPPMVVEGSLRTQADPNIARLAVGSEAVVTLRHRGDQLDPMTLPAGSKLKPMVGLQVRIESDRAPSVLECTATDHGDYFQDHRSVRVTIMGGPRTAEATSVPYSMLRPIR